MFEKDARCCSFVASEELERDVEFEVIGEAPDKAPPPPATQEEVNNIANGNKESSNQQSTSAERQHRSGNHRNNTKRSVYALLVMVDSDNALIFIYLF